MGADRQAPRGTQSPRSLLIVPRCNSRTSQTKALHPRRAGAARRGLRARMMPCLCEPISTELKLKSAPNAPKLRVILRPGALMKIWRGSGSMRPAAAPSLGRGPVKARRLDLLLYVPQPLGGQQRRWAPFTLLVAGTFSACSDFQDNWLSRDPERNPLHGRICAFWYGFLSAEAAQHSAESVDVQRNDRAAQS
jgi:hypothetical protein